MIEATTISLLWKWVEKSACQRLMISQLKHCMSLCLSWFKSGNSLACNSQVCMLLHTVPGCIENVLQQALQAELCEHPNGRRYDLFFSWTFKLITFLYSVFKASFFPPDQRYLLILAPVSAQMLQTVDLSNFLNCLILLPVTRGSAL